jgi:rRNA-processing protein FCF1
MSYKIMLDSNFFDYIYDHDLVEKMRNSSKSGKMNYHVTELQKPELSKIPESKRKKLMENC